MKIIEIEKGHAILKISSADIFKLNQALSAVTHQYRDIDHTILESSQEELEDLNSELYKIIDAIGRYESKNL